MSSPTPPDSRIEWIRRRAAEVTGEPQPALPAIIRDTSNFMSIERGHVIDLAGELFLVRSNEHEGRFGIDDQPKFWVKHAIDLQTGRTVIVKLEFAEQFRIHVGPIQIRCWRSPKKEGRVLEAVQGKPNFMQGRAVRDAAGNLVRVIDFIHGRTLLDSVQDLRVKHERYCAEFLPGILAGVAEAFAGIDELHRAGLCHGDIRNDHLFVEAGTGRYRWIDFDLDQESPVFDLWSAGNILQYVCAAGFLSFRDVSEKYPECSAALTHEDASVFFPHRVMNLGRVYGYLPSGLNKILSRFSFGSRVRYERMRQVAADVAECAAAR
jgi:hypothetical protein